MTGSIVIVDQDVPLLVFHHLRLLSSLAFRGDIITHHLLFYFTRWCQNRAGDMCLQSIVGMFVGWISRCCYS